MTNVGILMSYEMNLILNNVWDFDRLKMQQIIWIQSQKKYDILVRGNEFLGYFLGTP